MSPRDSKKKPAKAKAAKAKKSAVKKVKGPVADPDIYVGLLFVSTAALITGISFLVTELNNYGWAPGK